MTTKTIDVNAAQASLADLAHLAHAGAEIILQAGGAPLAKIVSVPPVPVYKPRTPGLHPGAIQTSDDFDEPLPDAFWLGEE